MNSLGLGEEKEVVNDVILIFNIKNGSVQINYLTIDPKSKRKILPKINHVTWPKLKNIIDYEIVVLDNMLYVLGGFDTDTGKHTNTVMKFDPFTNKWTVCSSMKKCRSKFTACIMDKRIFVAGGEVSEDGKATDSCEAYEPLIDMWSPEGKLISPRKDHACVLWAERLYLTGGTRNFKDYYCDNFWQMKKHFPNPMIPEYKYKWFHMGPSSKNCLLLPRKVREHATAVCNDVLYVLGGIAEGMSYDGQYLHDSRLDFHETKMTPGAAIENNTDDQNDDDVELQTSNEDNDIKDTTKTFRDILDNKSRMSDSFTQGKLIQATSQFLETCNLKDTLPAIPPPELKVGKKDKRKKEPKQEPIKKPDPTFSRCTNMRHPRCGAATIVLDHRIYVIGGHTYEDPDEHVNMIEYYNTKKKKWCKGFPLGDGAFNDVKCCVLTVPESNSDFKSIFPYTWPLW